MMRRYRASGGQADKAPRAATPRAGSRGIGRWRPSDHPLALAALTIALLVSACSNVSNESSAHSVDAVALEAAPNQTPSTAPSTSSAAPAPAEALSPSATPGAAPPIIETSTTETPASAEGSKLPDSEPQVEAETTEEAAALGATVALPSVEVVNLASGEMADLGTFARPGATLVWFWAPH